MKQVGDGTPYLLAKKGNITQVKYTEGHHPDYLEFAGGRKVYSPYRGGNVREQYYDDGLNTAVINQYGRAERGRVTVNNFDYDADLKIYGEGSEYLTKNKRYAIDNGDILHWDNYSPADRSKSANAARRLIKEVENEADLKRLDLEELFKPFEA